MINPANTRPVVAPTVISTASNGDGPESIALPIAQRVAVLKNLAWSPTLPRKICGGGSSLGSARPSAQQTSQMPANRPIDRQVQNALASQAGGTIAAWDVVRLPTPSLPRKGGGGAAESPPPL